MRGGGEVAVSRLDGGRVHTHSCHRCVPWSKRVKRSAQLGPQIRGTAVDSSPELHGAAALALLLLHHTFHTPSPTHDTTTMPFQPSNRSRRESRDVQSASHSTLVDRLELLAIARAAPSTPPTASEALDSGYSSEDNECFSGTGPRTRRRRSSFADTTWVTEWLSRIARGSKDVPLNSQNRDGRRVEKLATEALAIVEDRKSVV